MPVRAAATPPTDGAGSSGRGRLYVGTSGFAYPGWSPRFYPRGLKGDGFLRHYASRLPAVELNNTFYQSPSPSKVATWLDATPPDFRFSVKAQRGGSWRAMSGSPDQGLPWLTDPIRKFGDKLGTILFRVPGHGEARRRPTRGAAGCVAQGAALDHRVQGSHLGRRRGHDAVARCGGRALHHGGRRGRGTADASTHRLRSSISVSADMTTPRSRSPRGTTGSNRSSPQATTRSSSFATMRRVVVPSWLSSSRRPSTSPCRASTRPARTSRAGPGAPRCRGSDARRPAPTKTTEPLRMGRTSPPTMTFARPDITTYSSSSVWGDCGSVAPASRTYRPPDRSGTETNSWYRRPLAVRADSSSSSSHASIARAYRPRRHRGAARSA